MLGYLSSIVGSGKAQLPCNLGEQVSDAWLTWKLHKGTTKEDNSPVSVFKIATASPNDARLNAARNGVKRLRSLRHPNVLQFKDSHEGDPEKSGAGPTLFVITEPVRPVLEVLEELKLGGKSREEFLAWGLNQIAQAVSFLNKDAKMVHGCVNISAVYVTDKLDWKLAAFDLLSEWSEQRPPEALQSGSFMLEEQFKPDEVRKGNWAALQSAPAWAVDSWGFGCLVHEVFSGRRLSRTEELRELGTIPEGLKAEYQRLLSSNAQRRLDPTKIMESSLFQSKLVDTISFLDKLAIKEQTEKDAFFRRLTGALDALPQPLVERRLLPIIAAGLEFGSASSLALPPLLHACRSVPPERFKASILPSVVRLFASTDRAMRVCLLQNMDVFVEHIDATLLDTTLFEQVCTGFTDSTPFLRELTLKSMLLLAPRLSARTLNQNVLKHLSKLQVDEEPAIRANTTICLGNLSRYLQPATCKRVLLNAFTRALRDSFPPARSAGLLALKATMAHYDGQEVAMRLLPSVSPLAVDADAEVRTAALDLIDVCIAALRKLHQQALAGEAAAKADGKPADGQPAAPAAAAASGVSGAFLGWAASSVGALVGGSSGILGGGTPPAAAGKTQARTGPPPGEPAAAPAAAAPAKPAASDSSKSWGQAPVAASADAAADGWDGDDADDFAPLEDDDEEAKARARLGAAKAAAPSRPTSARPAAPAGRTEPAGPSPQVAAARPVSAAPSAGVAGGASAAGAASRPALGSSGAGAPGGGMKLGGAAKPKLGAQKLKPGDIDLESLLAD